MALRRCLFKLGILISCIAATAGFASENACARVFPEKPIRIIVPFAPGGGNDFIARFIAQRLTAELSQQVIVENRPGAEGMVGVEAGVLAPADGYTLTSFHLVTPSIPQSIKQNLTRSMTLLRSFRFHPARCLSWPIRLSG